LACRLFLVTHSLIWWLVEKITYGEKEAKMSPNTKKGGRRGCGEMFVDRARQLAG
jgi:hypothetical protein